MKIRWLGKNVNLHLLCHEIKGFFEREKFKIYSEESDSGVIFSATRMVDENRLTVNVKVEGEPADFSVEVECRRVRGSLYMFGQLLSLVGLGGFFVRELNLQDIYEKLERNFLAFLEATVSNLVGSAESSDYPD